MKTYAGDLDPEEAWELLKTTPDSRLIDVRTQAEWQFVGLPDLSSLEKQPLLISWQVFPTMARNEAFAQQLAGQGLTLETTLVFLCRSGVRSKAAAELMTSLGYENCWNVSTGFEGPLDDLHHRGSRAGWKAQKLPWQQG